MNKCEVKIKKLDEKATIPTYGTQLSAGADLYACLEEPLEIGVGETKIVHTGLAFEIPVGYGGFVYARSGMATKRGLAPANKVGVIDSDYRGEVMVALHNHGKETQIIEHGERVAQLVVMPYLPCEFIPCEELSDTVRGEGGFGSTGRK